MKILHMVMIILVLRVYLWLSKVPFVAPKPLSRPQLAIVVQRIHQLEPVAKVSSSTSVWRRYQQLVQPLPAVIADISTMLRRKEQGNDQDLDARLLARYQHCPDYYLKNYHHQTDGYLSITSARRYDLQYEMVFLGLGEVVRQVACSQLLRFLDNTQAYAMLELGAGTGNFGAVMQDYYPASHILLTDPSIDYLHYAQKKYPHLHYRHMSTFAENLSFVEDGTYDVIFSSFVFHEIPQQPMAQAFSELQRCLKPGGYLLILDSSQDDDGVENHFAINQFAESFHEPYFADYRQTPLEQHCSAQQIEVVYTQMVLFSKLIIGKKIA